MEGFALPAHDAGRPVTGHFRQHIFVPQARLSEVMEKSYDSPVWAETAKQCVGCGTCNLVCPTCYCFNVEEKVDVTVTGGHRERHWDGCMLRKFSEVAGGEVFRETLAARQRHRVYRKFKYISDTTGQPWCVGCGRCTAACPAGISIVGIVNRLISDREQAVVAPI
jgi:ferredoxin